MKARMDTKFWVVLDEFDDDFVIVYDAGGEGSNPPYNLAVMHIDFFYGKGQNEIYDRLSKGDKLVLDVRFVISDDEMPGGYTSRRKIRNLERELAAVRKDWKADYQLLVDANTELANLRKKFEESE